MSEWASDGLEALHLSLVRSEDDQAELSEEEAAKLSDFHPAFVYPIFGDEETIFGYKGLRVQLSFASGSLHQYLSTTFTSKFPAAGSVKPDDPEQKLYEFIPPSYTKILVDFQATVEREATEFHPCGERVARYRLLESEDVEGWNKGKGKAKIPERKWVMMDEVDEEEDEFGKTFEVYRTTWSTPGFKEFHRRMQVFVLLYIEGATYIEEDDDRWEFLTLFERRERVDGTPMLDGATSWHFAGFTSFYSFFCWPDSKRLRLSQCVVLPPYQGQGHGSAMYNIAYESVLQRPDISELTVEDPSEAFEDMRDKADLHTLLEGGDLDGLSAPIDRSVTEKIRKKYKLADRQFYRLVEMILLLNLDTSNPAASKAYRLMVKKRLYLFNREVLVQIEAEERKEKLQETFEGVEGDYKRILEGFMV